MDLFLRHSIFPFFPNYFYCRSLLIFSFFSFFYYLASFLVSLVFYFSLFLLLFCFPGLFTLSPSFIFFLSLFLLLSALSSSPFAHFLLLFGILPLHFSPSVSILRPGFLSYSPFHIIYMFLVFLFCFIFFICLFLY